MQDIQDKPLPRHVAIIMDGNGRWAARRGLPRIAGHAAGAKTVTRIVTHARKMNVPVLTLFAFSTQNWQRPATEVSALMTLLADSIRAERPTLIKNGIRLTAIGQVDRLPNAPRQALLDLIEDTRHLDGMKLCLALSYGGQEEILEAVRQAMHEARSGAIDPEGMDTARFGQLLWSCDLGPVDLLVRTSGEQRVSNFMLWQLAYAEMVFSEKLWPDFTEKDLALAIDAFGNRERRYGKVR